MGRLGKCWVQSVSKGLCGRLAVGRFDQVRFRWQVEGGVGVENSFRPEHREPHVPMLPLFYGHEEQLKDSEKT